MTNQSSPMLLYAASNLKLCTAGGFLGRNLDFEMAISDQMEHESLAAA